jgi:hypothetical protein
MSALTVLTILCILTNNLKIRPQRYAIIPLFNGKPTSLSQIPTEIVESVKSD